MKKTREAIKKALVWCNGKKTYVIALSGLVWGIYTADNEVVLLALGLLGVRHGISTEIAKVLAKK